MKKSLHTIGQTGLVLVVATALAAVVAGGSQASTRQTGAFPPPEAVRAASASWAAKGRLLDALGQPRAQATLAAPPSTAIEAASASWAAKGRLLDALGQPRAQASTDAGGHGLDWGDFAIGVGATLGLVLLASGLAAVWNGRRGRLSARPAS